MGKVIIFSAPSGSGKTTIVRELLQRYPQFEFSVSATCRAPRGQEQHGRDYYFLTPEAFMQAVEQDRDYALVTPASGKEQGRLNAREVFNLLVDKAWQSGDPGIIFLDRINRDNPTPAQGEIESTNPCGEQPLLPYEACNLGSLNLSSFFVPGQRRSTSSMSAISSSGVRARPG